MSRLRSGPPKSIPKKPMRVFTVDIDDADCEAYNQCGIRLRSGGLVAFPTETVYGLGANGLDREALLALFAAKRRPLSDPVILHVAEPDAALKLWNLTTEELGIVQRLQAAFWPGPCTIVARQASVVPDEATAASGFAACRLPAHPVAQRLIRAAGVPVAGPSANLFGRITPTQAVHVRKYFEDEPNIDLLECDQCCGVGIESTVVKVEGLTIEILRQGAVTHTMIQTVVSGLETQVQSRPQPAVAPCGAACHSPGQLLKHYSPIVRTYLLVPAPRGRPLATQELRHAVLVDVTGEYKSLKGNVAEYLCLSDVGNSHEIAHRLFGVLHVAEQKALALNATILLGLNGSLVKGDNEDLRGVYDRMYRAAMGEFVCIEKN
eukprot:Protomagalhaensia_sp_Gyna_25__2041@NODE_209_length_4399_cov_52_558257_g163_i0_p1_GENE_NODE_209_length_4399_cov_52_558257_g163_i0NODE_209_length_4399_cov_52_558257_g163_i0_p1_ORF_typecomplete_len378_score54_28Sua5_yciO_yrdC/PF01300_18/3e46SUA5/PF03481_13/2_3e11_NODE_209_length_4399_cov_52_558257_g163_i012332366